jgi:hypothetical protein
MTKSLIVMYKDNVLVIEPHKCLELEIKLNNSEYGKVWDKLGDILYAWSGTNYQNLCNYPYHNVCDQQYNWLKKNLLD